MSKESARVLTVLNPWFNLAYGVVYWIHKWVLEVIMNAVYAYLGNSIQTLQAVILGITVILHIIFAGAVAKDAGRLAKQGFPTFLVSGITWAFATLVGGVWVVAVYWLLHRSTLTRVF